MSPELRHTIVDPHKRHQGAAIRECELALVGSEDNSSVLDQACMIHLKSQALGEVSVATSVSIEQSMNESVFGPTRGECSVFDDMLLVSLSQS